MAIEEFSTYKKAAILVISLGADVAVEVFKYLDERDIEILSKEIAKLGSLEKEVIDGVLDDFHKRLLTLTSAEGGLEYLREVLERSIGAHKTMNIIKRLSEIQPFSYFESAPAEQIAGIVSSESPQIVALVLSYLPAKHAADVFANLNEDLRKEVALQIIGLKNVHREAIENIHKALERVTASKETSFSERVSFEGVSVRTLANILNSSPRQVEKGIMEHIAVVDNTIADEVRSNMFLFEDIIMLDDFALQKVLRQVEMKDLTLAMKVADEKLKDKIFNNLSERVRDIARDELTYLGPVRLSQVEEAQINIVSVIRKLEATGEITMPRKGEKEQLV